MANLNVFIDGSWLFKVCGAEKALAASTEWPQHAFRLDFSKMNKALLEYASRSVPACTKLGQLYLSTSIFALPDNFEEWPNEYENITSLDISITKNSVSARDRFVKGALEVGYSPDAIYRPKIKGWMVEKLRNRQFQEKQVDATVVALLVRAAITSPDDVHVVITGDADILPAIRVAYPSYSRNVLIATTHPDELLAERRQTSFSLHNFKFDIPAFYLQEHSASLLQGENVYRCAHCNKVFSRPRPIPANNRPCCKPCDEKRT